jgi:hypothetical protein
MPKLSDIRAEVKAKTRVEQRVAFRVARSALAIHAAAFIDACRILTATLLPASSNQIPDSQAKLAG